VQPDDGNDDSYAFRRVIQLPYPTPMVFGALIKGVLKFSGFEAALRVCQGMAHEGWGLCMSGLNPLLLDCVARRDWTSGLAVWNQVKALKDKERRRSKVPGRIPLSNFATMLQLCTRCRQKDAFEEVMEEASMVYPEALQALLRLVQLGEEATPVSEYPELERPEKRQDDLASHPLADSVENAQSSGSRPLDDFGLPFESSSQEVVDELASVEDEDRAFGGMSWTSGEEQRPSTAPQNTSSGSSTSTLEKRTVHKTKAGKTLHSFMTEAELHGHLPASEHLEEYERRERPMFL